MHMTKRLLSLNHFACHLFSILSLLLVISVSILLSGEMVYAGISCESKTLGLNSVTDNEVARTYTISAACTAVNGDHIEPFIVNIGGIWSKSDSSAIEIADSVFGQLRRVFQCDYDPWLEPGHNCKRTSTDYLPKYDSVGPVTSVTPGGQFIHNAQSWWADYEDMNFRQNFPTSALALDQYKRRELASQAMTRTLKIIDPVENQSFSSPDLMVTAVMERPVINPPDYAVAIKVEEMAWPESGVPPKNRKYEEGKNYLKTANQLITYFNMKGKDLWGAKWGVSAHVVSKEPGWTPVIYFTVDALVAGDLGSTLSEPPVNQLNPPHIHTPRANHTYTLAEDVPLKISYDPEAELTINYSSRPTGGTDFKHYVTWRYTPEHSQHPGLIELTNFLSSPALFADSVDAEVKVEAFIKKMQEGVELTSETATVIARILVPKPEISKPEENKEYAAPAEVNLIIIKSHKGSDSWKNRIEMEVQSAGHGGPYLSNLFMPYTDDTYVVSEVFNTLIIKYQLKTPGKYRFRARFATPESYNTPGKATPWTDWRQIEVLGIINTDGATNISIDKPTSAMQKVEGQQLKPEFSAEQLRLQNNKISQTVTAQKQAFKLKTAPVFVQPRNLQEIARRGSVGFKVKGIEDKDQLDWQIEYKKFGTSRYSRMRMAKPLVVSGNNQITGSVRASKEGDYRIRVRSKEKGSLWSTWRLFRVGKPKVKTNAERSLKPTVKKPLEQNSSTQGVGSPEQKEPKTITPIEKNEIPKLKEQSGQDIKPTRINNSSFGVDAKTTIKSVD